MWHNKKKDPFAFPSIEVAPEKIKELSIPSMELPEAKSPRSPRTPRFGKLKTLLGK